MHNFIVLDVETGGLDAAVFQITDIALQVLDSRTLVVKESYQAYIKPYNDLRIDPEVLKKTQVTMKNINNGKKANQVGKDLVTICKKYKIGKWNLPIIVGHNIDFDIKHLKGLFKYLNKHLFDYFDPIPMDTLKMAKMAERNVRESRDWRYKLGIVCERNGISLVGAHGAVNDVEATVQLFKIYSGYIDVNRTGESNKSNDSKVKKSRGFFQIKADG